MKRSYFVIMFMVFAILLGALILDPIMLAFGQEGADDDVAPAPPSIGADIPLTYFGPAPSQVQRELIGPFQLLKSGEVDLDEYAVLHDCLAGRETSGHEFLKPLRERHVAGKRQVRPQYPGYGRGWLSRELRLQVPSHRSQRAADFVMFLSAGAGWFVSQFLRQ